MTQKFFLKLIKNPLVIIGLIMIYLLYSFLDREGFLSKRRESLTSSSCKAVKIKLEKNRPKEWSKIDCQNIYTLYIEVDSSLLPSAKEVNDVRGALYRELANTLTQIAKKSSYVGLKANDPRKSKIKILTQEGDRVDVQTSKPGEIEISANESLERTQSVRVKIVHPLLEINALSTGLNISKLTNMSSPKFISEHLQKTVKVSEKVR